ncbi:MAG: hypothetical protein V4604_13735 [Bacteroidota bacterium]
MEIYLLEDIMRLIQQEQRIGFHNLNQLVFTMNNKKMNPVRKRFAIIAALRYLDLYEVGYNGTPFIPKDRIDELSELETAQFNQGKFIPPVLQISHISILDGTIRIDLLLN